MASNVRGGDEAFGPARALDGDIDTYWATDDDVRTASLEVDLGAPATFNVSRVQEYIPLGERVRGYTIEAWQDGAWKEIVKGTTVGHKKLERFPDVTAQKVRLTVTESRTCPLIAGFGVHYAAR
ncbi:MAG TPA: discoidin domain-containing protein [Candidatus Hydrogenedentes bacterium]|nr:discoidin domain-containing protein [Candidatus Hydrogenedentota bacterium]